MTSRLYISIFVATAIVFVPVFVFLIVGARIAPISYYFLEFSQGRVGGAPVILVIGEIVQAALYVGLFYWAARLSFRLSRMGGNTLTQGTLQIVFLVLLLACSLLPILGEADIRGCTGTYNFWTAAVQYFKVYPAYGSGRRF